MSQNEFSNTHVLDEQQLDAVSGGSPYGDGLRFGETLAAMYWGARNYLSGTVYPYWLG